MTYLNHSSNVTFVDIVSFDYYDGALQGFVIADDARTFYFEVEAVDQDFFVRSHLLVLSDTHLSEVRKILAGVSDWPPGDTTPLGQLVRVEKQKVPQYSFNGHMSMRTEHRLTLATTVQRWHDELFVSFYNVPIDPGLIEMDNTHS